MPRDPTRLEAYPPAATALKREVMTHFGHACACCGETELALLCLDHKRGGGSIERRAMKRRGSSFYREVKAAMDRDAPGDRRWLDTLWIHCQACNRSKGAAAACTIHHGVRAENTQMVQDDSSVVLDEDSPPPLTRNVELDDSARVQLSGRVKASTRQWIKEQPLDIGTVLDRLVEEKRNGEATLLSELRAFVAYQQQVNRELFNLLSDVKLHGLDPVSADGKPYDDSYYDQPALPPMLMRETPPLVPQTKGWRWPFRR